MATEGLIAATDFCSYHSIEYAFISTLEDAGLVKFTLVNEQKFIPFEQVQQLEKMARLHQELEINVPGIASIMEILARVELMQDEIRQLKNRLQFYESR